MSVMLCATSAASVRPARSPTRGSVVDARVAIGGSATGPTADIGERLGPADDDRAHAAARSVTTAQASEMTAPGAMKRLLIRATLISGLFGDTMRASLASVR